MEGNACYKFTTIRRFLTVTGGPPIRTIVDVGTNVGDTVLLAREVFPDARIIGFEPVARYLREATSRTQHLRNVDLRLGAVTSEHLYEDDLGTRPRAKPSVLEIHRALPSAGAGWIGGSMIKPAGSHEASAFEKLDDVVTPTTLQDLVDELGVIDVLKMDCEGAEHSILGCSPETALSQVRFIVGEYHGLERFVRTMRGRLFATHKVNIVADPIDKELGSFFAERLDGDHDGLLRFDKTGMLELRPWLSSEPFDWHLFDHRYVTDEERGWHGY